MNKYISTFTITDHELYNCSALTPEQQLVNPRYRRPIWGWFSIIFGFVSLILNILCIRAMLLPKHWMQSCYKLMAFLTFFDTGSIIFGSIIYGTIFVTGVTFCDFPNIFYLTGAGGFTSYITSSTVCLLLVIQRIVELSDIIFLKNIFSTSKIYFLIFCCCLYGTIGCMFFPPPIPSSFYGAGSSDPMIYPDRHNEYTNYMLMINNYGIVGITSILYLGFARRLHEAFQKANKLCHFQNRAMILQITILSIFYFSTAFCYVIIQNITKLPFPVFLAAQILYVLVTGLPCYLYLILNISLRKDVYDILLKGMRKTRLTFSSISLSTKI